MRVGQLVLITNNKNVHRIGGKLEDKWLDPYEIVSCLDKGRVQLENLQSAKTLKIPYHSVNLKVYNSGNENDEPGVVLEVNVNAIGFCVCKIRAVVLSRKTCIKLQLLSSCIQISAVVLSKKNLYLDMIINLYSIIHSLTTAQIRQK